MPTVLGGVGVFVLASGLFGCSKTSVGELRKTNKTTIDTAVAAYASIERVMAATTPVVDGPCSKPGLVPVAPISIGTPNPRDLFGPPGDGNTELVDAGFVIAKKGDPFPGLNGLFRTEGPVDRAVNEVRFSKTEPSFKVDKVRAQKDYDAVAKVKHLLVTRVRKVNTGTPADYADVFLFDYPSANLVCSFAIDAGADRAFAREHYYDPKTGEPAKPTYSSEPEALKAAFANALRSRFGITYPASGNVVARLDDDSKVRARAEAASKAVDAADKLPECSAEEATGGVRINKKALRIMTGANLLPYRDPNVGVDATNSAPVATYLRSRDPAAAATLTTTERWRILDVTSGGPAASLDQKSFVGGGAAGRVVTLDAQNRAKCEKRFSLAPPDKIDTKVRTTSTGAFSTSDIRERSAADLRKRLDAAIGNP